MPRGFVRAALLSALGATLAAGAARAQDAAVESPSGVRIAVRADGAYAVSGPAAGGGPRWTLAGAAGAPAEDLRISYGGDAAGTYQPIEFTERPPSGPARTERLRAYDGVPAVLFTAAAAAPAAPVVFPDFTRLPPGLGRFSYQEQVFAPCRFAAEDNGTPWLLFDRSGRAAILSPAAHFMTASMVGDGIREAGCGQDPAVRRLPAGFAERALLVFGHGINRTWDAWGGTLQRLVGRTAPPNDLDTGLRYLGYWTDNGAYYYYNYNPALGYAGTLERLVGHFRSAGVPVRYLQLDSWWYEKSFRDPDGRMGRIKDRRLPAGEWNRYGGLLLYRADPFVFPHGLDGFQAAVNLPLITHNRWIDPASPYHRDYAISGYAAVDPRWWDNTMDYLSGAGVTCYEQDWLNYIYLDSPRLRSTPGVAERFTGGMADAAAARHMSVQYCMALPRYFLQGAAYDNLTTIRVSDDRFCRARWDNFLYTSRLAGALGIWPWSDVFLSTETDNLLLANLSAGMVGFGDRIGTESKANLLRVCRPDGVLIKPDQPIYPTDETYLADAAGGEKRPMVAWTRTANPATAYVFAYRRSANEAPGTFVPAEMGLSGPVVVLNVRTGKAWRQPADRPVTVEFPGTSSDAGDTFPGLGGNRRVTVVLSDPAYYEVAQADPSGLAFFGDEGKFVSNGSGRIAAFHREEDGAELAVLFARGEGPATLFGYSPKAPTVRVMEGQAGQVRWNPQTGKFEVEVVPGARAYWGSPSANLPPDQTQICRLEITER